MKQLKPVRKTLLAGWAAGLCLLTLVISVVMIKNGATPMTPHPLIAIVVVGFAVYLWITGSAVRKLAKKEDTWMTPAQAGYVTVFAQSSAYFASMLIGVMAALVLAALPRLEAPMMSRLALYAGVCLAAAIFLLVTGLVVEKWCIVDDGDDDGDDTPQGAANAAAA